MISAVSRWRWQGDARAERVRVASADGGAVVLDAKGKITLLDDAGKAVWTRTVEDSMRDIAIPARGKEAYALSVREVVRFGLTGKAIWRIPPPPFPVRMAVRRDGEVFAVCAGQSLVRLYEATTGRDLGGQRVRHAADHVALLAVELADDGTRRKGPPQRATLTAIVAERGDVTMLDHLGQPHWTVSLGATAGAPDAAHDRVVVPSFDGVHAFLLDGTPAGLYDVGSPPVRAILDDDAARLLVLDARHRLFLLDAHDGSTLWHFQLPEECADVSFSGDGRAIAVALRSGAIERLQVVDAAAAAAVAGAPLTLAAPSAVEAPPAGFLEMPEEPGPKWRPTPRWRVKVEARAPQLALLRSGEGIALLDADRGELSLYTGGTFPEWTESGLGPGGRLAAGVAGDPIVVAGPAGVRFFSFERGPLGRAPLAATHLAVADSGAATLVGTSSLRLHLFDGAAKPVWDVPTPGFRRIAVSPLGMELAIAREDGTVVFQVRGRKGGWSRELGGTGFLSGEEEEGARAVEMRVLEEGVAFATAGGRAGFVAADGTVLLDARLPGGRAVAEVIPVAGEILVRDAANGIARFVRSPAWRVDAVPGAGDPNSLSRFAFALDHLLEFRYDSKEIASIDTSTGAVIWKRALTEAPKAVVVAPDGSCLAAVVSGELVLYDLIPAGSAVTSGPDTQRFLEL